MAGSSSIVERLEIRDWSASSSPISNLQSQILYRHMRCVCLPHVSACQHIALNRTEPGAQAVIEHLIADPNDQTTDQRWVNAIAQLQPLAIACAQVAGDLG